MKRGTMVVLAAACSLLTSTWATGASFRIPDLATEGANAGQPRGDRLGVNLPEEIFPDARGSQGDASMTQVRTELSAAGAGWVRTDVGVGVYRAMFQNSTECDGTDRLCDADKLSGFKVLGIIDHVTVRDAALIPCTFAPGAFSEKDFTLEDWKQLVNCVSSLFKGKIDAYEIWNEPTVCASGGLCFQGGYQNGTSLHYFEMLKSAYEIIKRNDPSAIVVGLGGVQAYVGGSDGQALLERDKQFATDVMKLGGRGYADAISVHAYSWENCSEAIWDSYRTSTVSYHRLWGKPIWITETGQRAGGSCSQARYRNGAFSAFSPTMVDKTFWFALRDTADGAFGLTGRTGPNFLQESGSETGAPAVPAPSAGTPPTPDSSTLVRTWGINWEPIASGTYSLTFSYPYPTIAGDRVKLPPETTIDVRERATTVVAVDITQGTASTTSVENPALAAGTGLLRVETVPAAEATITVRRIAPTASPVGRGPGLTQ